MRRREFVAASLSTIGLLAARPGVAKSKNCAAVVIGVDQPGSLPKLRAAASGAKEVYDWLKGEGFDAKLLSDANAPVHFHDVFDAVSSYVKLGTLDQLLVYFAGHGFTSRYDEIWVLSGAPGDPNDAIGVNGTKCLAQQSGIPNVILISDCCRSTANSLGVELVQGGVAFPNPTTLPNTVSDVDVFYATLVGNPSWEVSVDVSKLQYEGIFTATLLSAFQQPDASIVSIIDARNVVTNANLKPYLVREVPKRAQAVSISLVQRPHIEVVSGDKTFISHVVGDVQPVHPINAEAPATLSLLVSESLLQLRSYNPRDPVTGVHLSGELSRLSTETGFGQSTEHIIAARGLPDTGEDLKCGFSIFGKRVRQISTPAYVKASGTNWSDTQSTLSIEMSGQKSCSVALRFDDGSGCILAALNDFVGHVVVDEYGVANVSYEPSRNNPLRSEFDQERERLNLLHATVATSAKYGVFQIEGGKHDPRAAADMAARIRVLKAVDCTLGIYAAYAYADAGLIGDVKSVNDNLQGEYQTTFFDPAMLAGALPKDRGPAERARALVPICPMLSQGFSLLAAKKASLPKALEEAKNYMRPSLWTTFERRGMDRIEQLFIERSFAVTGRLKGAT